MLSLRLCSAHPIQTPRYFGRYLTPKKKQEGCLMGTIHMLPKADRENFKMPEDLIRSADKVILELNPDIGLEDRFEMAASMILPDKKKLPELISDLFLIGWINCSSIPSR